MKRAAYDVAENAKLRLAGKLTAAILSGQLPTGTRLPSERTMAAEEGVSKTVVHSAMEQLSASGLVAVKPKSGAYVADYMRDGNIGTLNAIVHFNGDDLSRDAAAAILELRLAIEGMALKCLCAERTAEDVALLRSKTAAIRVMADDGVAEAFFDWHRSVCVMSGKSILTLLMNTAHDVSMAFWVRYVVMYGRKFAADRLDAFADLIEAGDGDGAYKLLSDGIADYLARI